ncbi:RNA polymerase sigma factor [Nocardiopsis synnemataformans]|uniref:RNA polymerase sigma factor n=1 Tax=Nocardiopsis synnemataformans TaxID=61305 RepID=UPI003EBD2957
MTDRDLLHALRSGRTPPEDAYARLLDAYGAELYRRCILVLRDRDAAHVVLRDTLIVARAHIGRLADADRLGEWLHALAEAECARHRANGLRTGAPRELALPENTALVPLRVLNGMVGPELDGYRTHVAVRADRFDREGFPKPPRDPILTRGLASLLPVALALLCALLLIALAGYVLTTDSAHEPFPGPGAVASRGQR